MTAPLPTGEPPAPGARALTPDELDRLLALAEAATPGPWQRLDTGSEGCSVVSTTARPGRVARITSGPLERCQADAAFIAAANPDTIRALVAAVREPLEVREALRGANLTIRMMREHLAKDHPDCPFDVLGILNDGQYAALAEPKP